MLKEDNEVGLAAVAQSGKAIQLLSAELKADKEVGLAAVTQTGLAIRFLSAELKADKAIVLAPTQELLRQYSAASVDEYYRLHGVNQNSLINRVP